MCVDGARGLGVDRFGLEQLLDVDLVEKEEDENHLARLMEAFLEKRGLQLMDSSLAKLQLNCAVASRESMIF